MAARPQRPSAEKTRQKILHAAKQIFLQRGFDEAKIKDIAQKADVNTNLIFHHFTNKETLWNKVKDFILGDSLPIPNYQTTSAKSFFRSIIDYRFDLYGLYPDFASLIKWEPLSKSDNELISSQIYSPIHWLPIIEALQASGDITSTVDSRQIMMFIIYSSYAPFFQNIYHMNNDQIIKYKDMLLNMCCHEFCLS